MSTALAERIVAASPAGFWFLIGFIGLVTVAGALGAYAAMRRQRSMANTPTSRIRSAAQGYVELEGRGECMAGDPVVAPLSRRPCLWYRYRVDRRESSAARGRNRTTWRTVARGRSGALFYLVDDTGRCVIDPDGARVTPGAREIWYGSSARPSELGPRWGLGRRYRYTEERLHPGEPLYALGLFHRAGGAGAAPVAEADIRDRLRAWKQDRDQLLARFDANADGDIDLAEWQAVRSAATKEVTAERALSGVPPAVDVLGATGDPARPFLLSAVPQTGLIRRLQIRTAALTVLALAGAAFIFWAINQRI